jgi:hypothetical protein
MTEEGKQLWQHMYFLSDSLQKSREGKKAKSEQTVRRYKYEDISRKVNKVER